MIEREMLSSFMKFVSDIQNHMCKVEDGDIHIVYFIGHESSRQKLISLNQMFDCTDRVTNEKQRENEYF